MNYNDNPPLLEAMGGVAPNLPSRQIGATATRRLLKRLRGGGPARHIVLSSAGTEIGVADTRTAPT